MRSRRIKNSFRSPIVRGLASLLLLSVLILALPVSPGFAAEQRRTDVRVGYFYNGDFMHKGKDSSYAGYDVEYYYTLAGYADWNVQFVEYDSLSSALAALKKGEIDVMSGLSKTPERESSYLVSNLKMCTAQIAVQTRADDDRFAVGDPSTMSGLTCGILKASNVVTLYSEWCRSNGLAPHIVEYDSLDLRNKALMSGQVDAIAGGSTIEGAQKIAEFPSLELFFMFNREKAPLKAQLDRAMGILSLEDPSYTANLFLKYFPSSRNSSPSYSAGEKAFIASHPVVRTALLEDDAPFSKKNSDGSVSGILPEYYAHLSQTVGLTFSCIPFSSKAAAFAALNAGEVDLVGKLGNDVYDANSLGAILSVPFLRMNLVQITRAGTSAVSRAAVPECNIPSVRRFLSEAGSPVTAASCSSSELCFASLRSGESDAVICTQPAATWLLTRNRASDYVVSAFGSDTWNVSFALSPDADGNTLRSILNKAITVDGGYIDQLITSHTLRDSADVSSFLDRLPLSFLAVFAAVAVFLFAVALAALVIIIRRRRTEKMLAAQQAELTAAVEANKARHAFFGAVSHDMRTPLNGIMGFADLALGTDDLEKIRDYLSKIRLSGSILSSLVNDTLIMSRIENGKYVLKPSPCDTSELMDGVLESIREFSKEKDVEFVTRISAPRRWVMADRLSLQKILLNLLSNAVKFTPAGGKVTFDCQLIPSDTGRPDSVIRISDTGIGISKEFLPHIFEPFSQENSGNADTAGSGMGLSIVKSIVDAMGGTIEVVSEKGRGTAFTVRLSLPEISPPGPGAPGSPAGPDVLKGKRVLVCEDNALNLEIIRSVLERCGIAVTSAENGRLGVEAFQKSQPGYFDAVLLDLRMPVMDGKEAARAIRVLGRSDAGSVPILAVSADAYPENVEECLAAGMNGHISKPIDADRLISCLSDFWKR